MIALVAIVGAWAGRRVVVIPAALAAIYLQIGGSYSSGGVTRISFSANYVEFLLTYVAPIALTLAALAVLTQREDRPPMTWLGLPALPYALIAVEQVLARTSLGMSNGLRNTITLNIEHLPFLVAAVGIVALAWLITDSRPALGGRRGLPAPHGARITAHDRRYLSRTIRVMAGPIDNDVYNRLGESWWDETSLLSCLHGITPGRFVYFRDVLARLIGTEVAGLRVLDIGCGGGFLAEEFAALGCEVTGVDPSAGSIDAARAHALGQGLAIDYRVGAGEELPGPDAAFDLVYCCDVLEHVSDVDRVINETARVLRPGGLYLFDTINRTLKSKLLGIKAVQEWRLTRITDVAFHNWDMFITPAELTAILDRHGLSLREVTGLGPRANPLSMLRGLASARRGKLTYGELSRRMAYGQVRSTAISYMGFAIRTPA